MCVIVVVIVGVTNSLVNCYGYYCYPTLKIKIWQFYSFCVFFVLFSPLFLWHRYILQLYHVHGSLLRGLNDFNLELSSSLGRHSWDVQLGKQSQSILCQKITTVNQMSTDICAVPTRHGLYLMHPHLFLPPKNICQFNLIILNARDYNYQLFFLLPNFRFEWCFCNGFHGFSEWVVPVIKSR